MQQEEPNKYVKELTQEKYKYGFTTDVHTDIIERGLNEDVVRLISEKKGRTGMVAGVPPEGISPLADIGDAYMGTSPHSRNRLSGHILLCRPYEEEGRTEKYG
mgnify:CR=1 FL=1